MQYEARSLAEHQSYRQTGSGSKIIWKKLTVNSQAFKRHMNSDYSSGSTLLATQSAQWIAITSDHYSDLFSNHFRVFG